MCVCGVGVCMCGGGGGEMGAWPHVCSCDMKSGDNYTHHAKGFIIAGGRPAQ